MKNLKTTFAALVMVFVIIFGTTFANAGIIIAAKGDTTNCTATKTSGTSRDSGSKMNTGIIIAYTGIIIAYTGIIIAFKEDPTSTPCEDTTTANVGIIIA